MTKKLIIVMNRSFEQCCSSFSARAEPAMQGELEPEFRSGRGGGQLLEQPLLVVRQQRQRSGGAAPGRSPLLVRKQQLRCLQRLFHLWLLRGQWRHLCPSLLKPTGKKL